jgi:hypothetical protein
MCRKKLVSITFPGSDNVQPIDEFRLFDLDTTCQQIKQSVKSVQEDQITVHLVDDGDIAALFEVICTLITPRNFSVLLSKLYHRELWIQLN